jgi:hypothetical protein
METLAASARLIWMHFFPSGFSQAAAPRLLVAAAAPRQLLVAVIVEPSMHLKYDGVPSEKCFSPR